MDHKFQMQKYDEGQMSERSQKECERFSDLIKDSKEIFKFEKESNGLLEELSSNKVEQKV